jgi:hypothetical protein
MDYPDLFYHVLSHGNERKEIFRDEKDHLRFLDTLGDICEAGICFKGVSRAFS